jgi:hypothetical protein
MEKTIQEAVAEKVVKNGQNVATIVIDKLAEIEIQKRVDIITKSVLKEDQLEKDLKKINKNDIIQYQHVGNQPMEAMSKTRWDEIKKMKEKIAKLQQSIEFALVQNSLEAYNKLTETLKKLDNVGSNKTESTDDSE